MNSGVPRLWPLRKPRRSATANLNDEHFFTPDRESQPVFVVGVARSGTTMLRLMLNRSPGLAVLPETWFGTRVWDQRWALPIGDPSQPCLAKLVDSFIELLRKKSFNDAPCDFDLYRRRVLEGPASLNRLLSELGALWAERQNKPRWGEKSPIHVHYLGVFAKMFPLMKVVHIVRDPRDVCVSLAEAPFAPSNDVVAHALEWKDAIAAVSAAAADPTLRLSTVRYEDLVSDPAGELGRLCKFLELEFEDQMIDFHESYNEYAPKHDWIEGVKEPLNPSSIGRFRSELDRHDLTLIEALLLEDMEAFGYETIVPRAELHQIQAPVQRMDAAQRTRAEAERAMRGEVISMAKETYRSLLEGSSRRRRPEPNLGPRD